MQHTCAAALSRCNTQQTAQSVMPWWLLQELGWSIELLSYAPSDLYVQTSDINGFAAFAAWA